MPWTDHPTYRPIRNELIERLQQRQYWFKRLPPIVFLCGGAQSRRRDDIAAYLRRHTSAAVFYADDVWLHLAESSNARIHNALRLEGELGHLADLVMIVVESPGTFAELGAFALSDPLRVKLLPILDTKYKDEKSFINTGPVAWINEDSKFTPTIFADFEVILDSSPEIENRLDRLRTATPLDVRAIQLERDQKYFVFLIAQLVAIIGPATLRQVIFYITQLSSDLSPASIEANLAIAVCLGALRAFNHDGERYYFTGPSKLVSIEAKGTPRKSRAFDPDFWRARILSVLFKIDRARAVLEVLGRELNS